MTKKQRYCLAFHARADETISAPEKHVRFFEGIKELPIPWGLAGRPAPPCPEFGRRPVAAFSLTKFFGDGVKRAMLTYKYRRLLSDDGYSDDRLLIDFDPSKVDVQYLIYSVIPRYIEAFDAYRVDYYAEKFVTLAYKERAEPTSARAAHVNPRFTVEHIWPVSFFDEVLCRRAFSLSPDEVMVRLKDKVEHVQLVHNGVFVVGTSRIQSLDEAQHLCQQMMSAVRG